MNKLLLLGALLLSTNLLANNKTDINKLGQAVDEVNQYLSYNQESFNNFCPGVDLVISCGNYQCEKDSGENVDNCPSDCKENVTVRSYNNIILCSDYIESQIPHTTQEVADLVLKAISKGVSVKPIGASHSATELMCSEGMLVSMSQFNKVIGLKKITKPNGLKIDVVETQAGVTVYELSQWLHERNMALDGLPHMGFRDVTIAGSMATGSHGSTPHHSGVISNIVEAVEIVDGKGNIRYFERSSTTPNIFKALSAGLGLTGITTSVKLRVQPQFNLAVTTSYHAEEEIITNGVLNTVKDCDYGQLNWFPGTQKFMKTCGVKTSQAPHKEAHNELLSPVFPKFIVNPFKKVLQMGACSNFLMCLTERVRWWMFKINPPMLYENKRGKRVNSKFVIGPSHRMVSSHLTKDQNGFFQMDWEIAVPASRAQDAFHAIKKHLDENNTCLPLVGVFIRFAPSESQTLMAHTYSDGNEWKENETAVFFEIPVYVPVGFTQEEFDKYEKQYVEFTKMLIEKYSGRPHWGKNRQWAFDLALKVGAYRDSLPKFQQAITELDPHGTFSNRFSDQLGIKYSK